MLKLRPRLGVLNVLVVCAVIADSPLAKAQGALPSGWAHTDVGHPSVAGSASFSSGIFTIGGAGNIYGTFDQFHFVYRSLSGDVDIRARVESVKGVDPWAKAGLMVRESMNAGAKNAFMLVSAGHAVRFQWRPSTGGTTNRAEGPITTIPVWIRLVRLGNVFRAYTSPTGATWTLRGSATISMGATAYVGLAVSSRNAWQTATATLSNVSVVSTLPSPWKASGIGSPALTGSASASGGTFTVKGAGTGVWGTSDQFQFVYQPMTGDTEIVARIAGLLSSDGLGKAGVMIRAALTGSAAHASMFARTKDWAFQRRLVNGGTTYHSGTVGVPPGWVRVVREGSLFSAYQSTDGSYWRLVDTDTISMPATVYVGLAVTSQNTKTTATGTFTNVAVTVPGGSNKPPTVSISSPPSGATYAAPATMPITATAADVDGSVARVNFYAGSALVGSDTTSPWAVTWGSVPAGVYSIKAVATDNEGAQTTSAAITVKVAAPAAPATLVFVPGKDYATNATSCTVQLRRSSDAVTASPVATKNLGKPAAVNGQISVDISTLVSSLPLGSYYAVVITTGPGGSTPSSPSPTFSR